MVGEDGERHEGPSPHARSLPSPPDVCIEFIIVMVALPSLATSSNGMPVPSHSAKPNLDPT